MLIVESSIQAPRRNPEILEGIEQLDRKLMLAGGDEAMAWDSMTVKEMDFIADQLYMSTKPGQVYGVDGLLYWLCNFFFIKDKKAGFHPLFPLWDSQAMFLEFIDSRWRQGLPIWVMILKARQLGISTLVEAILLYLTIFNKSWNSLLLADDPGRTEYIFEMARVGYDSLPWWMRPEKRYDVKGHHIVFDRANAQQRATDPGLRSQLIAESANQRSGTGIGKTMLALHATEIPYYRDVRVLTEGVLPTVPETHPAVFAVLEGAAKQRNDHWNRMWKAAEAGEMNFEPLFIPWYGESQYFLPPTEGWTPNMETAAMAQSVKNMYNFILKDGQSFWYEQKRQNYIAFEEDDATFLSQYPSHPQEAFQNAGRCAFSKRKLHRMMTVYGRPPKWRGEVWLADDDRRPKLTRTSRPGDKLQTGRLKIWEWPWDVNESNASFYVSGDPSGGTATGHPAVWQVLFVPRNPQEPIRQVACWHGKAGPNAFARIGAALGYLYNEAEVCPEANNMGQTVVSDLKNVIKYRNLYRWKRDDKRGNTVSDFFGWLMTHQSKKSLISRMAEGINEDQIILQDVDTIDEGYDFVTDDGETYYAVTETGHGDRFVSLMIGYYCIYQSRPFLQRSAERAAALDQAADPNRDFINTDFSPLHDNAKREASQEEFLCL